MSIGIMDADLSKYTLVPFNLEAMKISTYYKKKGEIVVLSPSFTPERHQKFFYRKDYNDGEFPIGLTRSPNVEYGGLAFSNNIYQPLPIEIERMVPDTSIYQKMEKVIMGTDSPIKKKIFNNMMEAEHCRLSLDGKTVWPEYWKQFSNLPTCRNLMFHDYDLGAVEGAFEEVQKILSKARNDGWATKVGMKFPVQVKDGPSLIKWSSINTNSTFYSLRYEGVIDDDSFLEWIAQCKQRAVFTQMEYHVTAPWYDPNHFVEVLLPKILRQIIISRSYRIFFSLKYDEGFFPDRRWEAVLELFNYYHNSFSGMPQSTYYQKISDDTLFSFAEKSHNKPKDYYGEVLSKDQIRKIFMFVRQHHYPLFKDFYECSARTLGGKL